MGYDSVDLKLPQDRGWAFRNPGESPLATTMCWIIFCIISITPGTAGKKYWERSLEMMQDGANLPALLFLCRSLVSIMCNIY